MDPNSDPNLSDLFQDRTPRNSILLINPPDPTESSCNRDCNGGYGMAFPRHEKPTYPPMDFLYSASCLQLLGAEAKVLDTLGQAIDLERLNPSRFKLAAIRTSYPNFLNDLDFARALSRLAPDTAIYLFGPYLSTISSRDRERVLPHFGLIVGEAEVPLLRLVCGESPEQISGVLSAGSASNAEVEPYFLQNLDLLPSPDWELIDLDGYTLENTTGKEASTFSVLSSRGCHFRCHYCAYPLGHGRKIRFRSVDHVAAELEQLITRHQATQVVFRDPLFTADRQRVIKLLAAMRGLGEKHGRQLRWIAETRPDHLDPELLQEMASSGCLEINLGMETASREVSRQNGRPYTAPARIAEIVEQCRDLGINVFVFFLVGLPGDTEESILSTIDVIKVINPHFFKGFTVVPYPGTKVAAWAEERGLLGESEEDYASRGRVCWLRTEQLDEQKIRQLEVRAFRELSESKARWLLDNRQRASFPELQRDLLAHVANLEIGQRWDEIPRFITPLIESIESTAEELFFRRGNAYARMGDEEQALRDYREQARLSGESKLLLLRQMVSLASLGRAPEAEEALDRLVAMADNAAEAEHFRQAAARARVKTVSADPI